MGVAAAIVGQSSTVTADTSVPAHHPLYMAAIGQSKNPTIQPPAILLPPVCAPSTAPAPVGGTCVPWNGAPAGQPAMGNMAYFGGHVQVKPKLYVVFWGWGQAGAFDHTVKGMPASDPDGVGARELAFVKALGGTAWAGSQTQYFELLNGKQVNITNPKNQFAGVWYDNTNKIHNNVTGLELAQEAARAVAHFNVKDLKNAQVIVAQPQMYNEAGYAAGAGYCAWHDYTKNQYYPGVKEGISFTNMPYVYGNTSCGPNFVNAGPAGLYDGVTIVLGHEIEETVTDPGAGDVINGVQYGAWYDMGGYENGDKCAWVGDGLSTSIPGAANNIKGNDGKLYAVQSLWSNSSAGGAGYCAGAGNDLPF